MGTTSPRTAQKQDFFSCTADTARLERLTKLADRVACPCVGFDEAISITAQGMQLGPDVLTRELWVPVATTGSEATVILANPDDESLLLRIKAVLGVENLHRKAALPEDIIRIIEHNCDINPGFPKTAGRTPLARVRTYLALRRSQFSAYRTKLAKGRTGLAFFRTGLSFCTAALVLIRVFGFGYLVILEGALTLLGLYLVYDGFRWYIGARSIATKRVIVPKAPQTSEITILEVVSTDPRPTFRHTAPVEGATLQRNCWNNLSPVMRRRFLAIERTDLAEERTRLAAYRSILAKARTGLALTRTGISLVGIGLALLRTKGLPVWIYPDAVLIAVGLGMILEGLYWYFPGRHTSNGGLKTITSPEKEFSVWDLILPFRQNSEILRTNLQDMFLLKQDYLAGAFSSTGLALERTALADRRNLMARFRSVLARARTGMSLIRTGMNFIAVGLGLLVAYGVSASLWTALFFVILTLGVVLVIDGHYWYLPAEKWKKQFPFCKGDVEIMMPDYSVPYAQWEKVVFEHDD